MVYKRNEFKALSLAALKDYILILTPPTNIHELRLVDCNTSPDIMRQLLSFLSKNPCYLRSLALVQMQLNFALDDLAKLVEDSEYLQDLDISGNDLLPLHLAPLLLVLANNKKLHTLNLSWNQLLDKT